MITVNKLVQEYDLGLVFKTGKGMSDRKISWAHTVELPDPWLCTLKDTLVMTTGVGVPKTSSEQIMWIKKLAQTEAAALLFAPRDANFELSDEMLAIATKLGFPILGASFELEFKDLAQIVIEEALQTKKDQYNSNTLLFQIYADTLWESSSLQERLKILGKKLLVKLQVVNSETLQVILSSDPYPINAESVVRTIIPGRVKAALIVSNNQSKKFDSTMLSQTLAGLLSIELERFIIERDALRADGEQLFQDLLNGEIDYAAARMILERRGLHGRLVTVAINCLPESIQKYESAHHIPQLQSISPLFFKDDQRILIILPEDPELFEHIINYFGAEIRIGVSSTITLTVGFKESIFQASLMLSRAIESDIKAAYYRYLDTALSLGPKTLAEARSLVDHYFSVLIEYEKTKSLPLLQTLFVFLKNDSNWKLTAVDLNIHRQTLVYRLKLIGELTGLKPTSSIGIAKFWIALEAAQALGILKK